MSVLLITGAGASRNLGVEESPMPLMADWSDALCQALDKRESQLASACHLIPGMSGPQFEENLGLLLRWQQVRHLDERFQDLSGPQAGSHTNYVVEARREIAKRMQIVMETINVTLYEQFGQSRVDDDRAAATYKGLLEQLGDPELMLATTNYDRAVETALATLGHNVDAGFRNSPHRTPKLEPAGLVSERGSRTPVIHLHGAVGWYERDGDVGEQHADQGYNASLGTPVVLYPDPEKDPTSDAIVSQLWTEFEAALDEADAILVVGHSLHDPALVRALRRYKAKPMVITFNNDDDAKRIMDTVPTATAAEAEFGPDSLLDKKKIEPLQRASTAGESRKK